MEFYDQRDAEDAKYGIDRSMINGREVGGRRLRPANSVWQAAPRARTCVVWLPLRCGTAVACKEERARL